jgi:hypothetical protein
MVGTDPKLRTKDEQRELATDNSYTAAPGISIRNSGTMLVGPEF